MNAEFSIDLVNKEGSKVDKNVFDGVIGQSQARKKIQFFIDSHQDTTPFPTLLLTGGHGLGKTMFSSLIAKALNRQFVEINCSKVKTIPHFMELVFSEILDDRKPVTLFFDESHDLSDDITTLLLTLLNPNKLNVNKLKHNNLTLIWDLRLINVLFASTDGYRMFKPLRNRCQEVYFYPYDKNELYKIVKLYLPNVNLTCELNDLAMVCRARGRDAFVQATNIKRYLSITNGKDNFNQEDLNDMKDMLGISKLGLIRAEVELLQAIALNGPISSSNLATKLMVNQKNIEEELEIRLRELGLIESSARGRIVTTKGKQYLTNLPT